MPRLSIGFRSKSRICHDFSLAKAAQTKIQNIFQKEPDIKDFRWEMLQKSVIVPRKSAQMDSLFMQATHVLSEVVRIAI
jgi:hypothetical protein